MEKTKLIPLLAIVAGLVCLPQQAQNLKAAAEKPVTETQVRAIVEAIQDEVYSRRLQNGFFMIGEPLERDQATRIPLYVDPTLHGSTGWVVYKFMPYGEVYREFDFADGIVSFVANPFNNFPCTQPSRKTVCMNDDDIIRIKTSWKKAFVDIEFNPSRSRTKLALERQKRRGSYPT